MEKKNFKFNEVFKKGNSKFLFSMLFFRVGIGIGFVFLGLVGFLFYIINLFEVCCVVYGVI